MINKLVLIPLVNGGVEVCDLSMLIDGALSDDDKGWEDIVEEAAIDSTISFGPERQARELVMLAERVRVANASEDVGSAYWNWKSDA